MIIQSLLDTDLYKFTMMQVVLHRFPGAQVEYRFDCRSAGIDLRPYADAVRDEVEQLCSLRFAPDELSYLRDLRYLSADFVDFLRLFKLQRDYVDIRDDGEQLEIVIRGPWLHTILFEVPLLSIVNEVYFRASQPAPDYEEGRRRLREKVRLIGSHGDAAGFRFSDFGTRRRFSRDWHAEVVRSLHTSLPGHFAATSNVHVARSQHLMPVGTMAHEFLQACQALGPRLADSQKFAFETWAREYRGDLGIALSDVCGVDAFLRDFDLYFCKLFDGARHDSGDPFEWAEKVISHYRKMRIDPRTKTLVFSDGLTVPLALSIYDAFKDQARPAFGIGTNLTNDLGYEPLNIVIKMTECNGQPVAKLSDSPGKTLCRDEIFLAYLRQTFHGKSKDAA